MVDVKKVLKHFLLTFLILKKVNRLQLLTKHASVDCFGFETRTMNEVWLVFFLLGRDIDTLMIPRELTSLPRSFTLLTHTQKNNSWHQGKGNAGLVKGRIWKGRGRRYHYSGCDHSPPKQTFSL